MWIWGSRVQIPLVAPICAVFFVYILVCLRTRRSYVGHTDHLVRRFRMHCEGSTRTTREKLVEPVVVHWEHFPTRAEAMRRERYFKSGSGHRLRHEILARELKVFGVLG